MPDGFVAFEQEAADKIGRRQVFMTGNGNQRAFEPPRHVLDKTRLATPSRSFQYHGQARAVRRGEQIDFTVSLRASTTSSR